MIYIMPIFHHILKNHNFWDPMGPLGGPWDPLKRIEGPLTYTFHYVMCSNEFPYYWDQFQYTTCLQFFKMSKFLIFEPSRGPWGALGGLKIEIFQNRSNSLCKHPIHPRLPSGLHFGPFVLSIFQEMCDFSSSYPQVLGPQCHFI